MNLRDELDVLRRALDDVDRALRPLRERPASRRLVSRLEADLQRMQEDVDDLGLDAPAAQSSSAPFGSDFEPIPIPPADPVIGYDPEAEDEGLAGWRSPAPSLPTSKPGRRH